MSEKHQLGELQMAIMRVLWNHKEATAGEVHQALVKERGLAPTTIATMLKKMEVKGIVTHRTEGRSFVYQPTINEKDVKQSMVTELVNRVFRGNVSALVNHLLTDQEIEKDEIQQLKQMIEKHEKNSGEK